MAESRSRSSRTPEDQWLSDQDPEQKTRFLRDFVPKGQVHRLEGIKYPLSNSHAVELLLKCRCNNKFLKKIQGKASSSAITRNDDLLIFDPEGPFGPLFFNKRSAVRLINSALIYQMTSRSRRSAAKVVEQDIKSDVPKTSKTGHFGIRISKDLEGL